MSPFVPSAMPLLQHAFGLLQLRQQQLDEGRSEEPFAQQQLSFLPPVQQLQQDTNSMSRSGKEEAIARSFVEGGVAALQRTHKAATALRLQVFCDAFQVYRHITPLLLLRQFAAAAASGAALGLGASLGSAAASIQGGAFSALLLAARMEQQQPQHQRSIVIGDDKATYTALLAEAWRARKEQEQQQLHHHHQQGRGTKEQGTVADVGSALVDVLLSTWEQPSNSAATETAAAASSGPTAKAGHAEYRRKLREAATSACALLLQNNFVAAIDSETNSEEMHAIPMCVSVFEVLQLEKHALGVLMHIQTGVLFLFLLCCCCRCCCSAAAVAGTTAHGGVSQRQKQ